LIQAAIGEILNADERRRVRRLPDAEAVFSLIKGKVGDAVRGKIDTARINEILRNILCHSICVVIQAMHGLRVEPGFSPAPPCLTYGTVGRLSHPVQ
jgi:hypothetical protein